VDSLDQIEAWAGACINISGEMGEGRRMAWVTNGSHRWTSRITDCKWSVVEHERKKLERKLQQLHNTNGPTEEHIMRNFTRKVSCIFLNVDERFA
jgi:hypothetical protein